jgi:hypothetical protein
MGNGRLTQVERRWRLQLVRDRRSNSTCLRCYSGVVGWVCETRPVAAIRRRRQLGRATGRDLDRIREERMRTFAICQPATVNIRIGKEAHIVQLRLIDEAKGSRSLEERDVNRWGEVESGVDTILSPGCM